MTMTMHTGMITHTPMVPRGTVMTTITTTRTALPRYPPTTATMRPATAPTARRNPASRCTRRIRPEDRAHACRSAAHPGVPAFRFLFFRVIRP